MVDKACVTCHLALFDLATTELSTRSGPGSPEKEELSLFSRSLTVWGEADGQVVLAASEAIGGGGFRHQLRLGMAAALMDDGCLLALQEGREPDYSEYKEFKLTVENIGYQMLMKMGWKEGDGLGSEGQGIKNPVNK